MLVGKPEGKRPLGRPRRRLVNNIKMVIIIFWEISQKMIIIIVTAVETSNLTILK
jgi:hypothetical protein